MIDYVPGRNLRSMSQQRLTVPRYQTETASRRFSVCAPRVWNNLPLDVRNSVSIASFRKNLKTYYFGVAYKDKWCFLFLFPRLRFVVRLTFGAWTILLYCILLYNLKQSTHFQRYITCISRGTRGITGYLRREVIALGRFKHNWIVIVLYT